MEHIKENLFLIVTFGLGIVLELLIVASQWNQLNRLPGHEIGPWAIRMSSHWTTTVSWVVTILIAMAFIDVVVETNVIALVALVLGVILVEVWFGRVLPHPQNTWTFAIAFVFGVVGLAAKLLSKKETRQRLLGWWPGHDRAYT